MADYSDGEFVTDEKTKLKSFEVDGKSVTSHVVDVSKYQGDVDWKSREKLRHRRSYDKSRNPWIWFRRDCGRYKF